MLRTVFDPGDPATDAYDLLTSIVVPRPIAWITTVGPDGVGNLAPHSFFNVACQKPPMISFSSVGRKDTLRNVLATGYFVVNLVSEGMEDLANASSAPFAAGVDEAEALHIPLEPSEVVPVPRVLESAASIECRLHSSLKLGNSHLVIGEVRRWRRCGRSRDWDVTSGDARRRSCTSPGRNGPDQLRRWQFPHQ